MRVGYLSIPKKLWRGEDFGHADVITRIGVFSTNHFWELFRCTPKQGDALPFLLLLKIYAQKKSGKWEQQSTSFIPRLLCRIFVSYTTTSAIMSSNPIIIPDDLDTIDSSVCELYIVPQRYPQPCALSFF